MKLLRQLTNSKASLEERAGGADGATGTLERPLVVREPMRVRVCLVGAARDPSSFPGWPPRRVLVGSSRACVVAE